MVSPGPRTVLIAHYSPTVRLGLATLFNSTPEFKVAGVTGHAPTARQMFSERKPGLVVLSLMLQNGDGVSLLKDFKRVSPDVPVLVLSARSDSLSVQRAFKAGARGYVGIDDETTEVLQAAKLISTGKLYASGKVANGLLEMLSSGTVETRRNGFGQLSDRELEIFRLIGRGLGTSRVAQELHLSVKTIETHRERIKHKLGIQHSSELTRCAVEWLMEEIHGRTRASGNFNRANTPR